MQEGVQALQDKAANSELLCSGSYPAFDTVIKESYCNEGIEHTDSFSCVVLYCCKLKETSGKQELQPSVSFRDGAHLLNVQLDCFVIATSFV